MGPARTRTVRLGTVDVPAFVTLDRPRPATARRTAPDRPLLPALAWAAGLRLSPRQREVVTAVNDWLRDHPDAPAATTRERAYQVFGDEKALDGTPVGGATLWRPGRLTLDLLRCYTVPLPLTWEPVGRTVADGPLLAVENHHTWGTVLAWARDTGQQWTAVAWTRGNEAASVLADNVLRLPFAVTRVDYFGDLDLEGLRAAARATRALAAHGTPAGPAGPLWRLLLAQPARDCTGPPPVPEHARQAAAWLPADLSFHASSLLANGRVIRQEALRRDVLPR